jgi:hypothetical protein
LQPKAYRFSGRVLEVSEKGVWKAEYLIVKPILDLTNGKLVHGPVELLIKRSFRTQIDYSISSMIFFLSLSIPMPEHLVAGVAGSLHVLWIHKPVLGGRPGCMA